jgi:hypothetical protein
MSRLAMPDIGRLINHEPDRGPGLKFFRVGRSVPLIYMPIRGAWDDPVPDWLKRMEPDGEIDGGMTQRELRKWKRQHPGHRSFTVLRHPLPRAHDAFCRFVLPPDVETHAEIRDALVSKYGVPLPREYPDDAYSLDQHRAAFLAFLEFLAGNLGGQTSLRVDSSWASQHALLNAIGQFVVPDLVIRSENLASDLSVLAAEVGQDAPDIAADTGAAEPFALSEVVTEEIGKACARAYRRDCVMFGFGDWTPPA